MKKFLLIISAFLLSACGNNQQKPKIIEVYCMESKVSKLSEFIEVREFTTRNGVDCISLIQTWNGLVSLQCNFDKYNSETKYGEFPYAQPENDDE